jgi:sarcosine oxidase delta subunit
MQQNRLGIQKEWWYHRAGCGLWFLAERDTRNNEVMRTYAWNKERVQSPERGVGI